MNKLKIGDLIEFYKEKCHIKNLTKNQVSGIDMNKNFICPVNQIGADTSSYQYVPKHYFACNLMHVGRDFALPIALNRDNEKKIVSPAYQVFSIIKPNLMLNEYFLMLFKSKEFERFLAFQTDSSIRDGLEICRFCDIEIDLPSIPEQQKVVDVYNAIIANQKSYEAGLEDLKLTCDAYIENLRREMPSEAIGKYIEQRNEKNINNKILLAQGININKEFITPQRLGENLNGARVVRKGQFAYCDVMHKPDSKMPIALRKDEDCVVSGTYKTFEIIKPDKLLSEYLMMWFERPEFERYAAYNSFGSARPTFDFSEMQLFAIPIPDIKVQQAIVNIYNAYIMRKEINEKLKAQIKDICPILIRGSLKK